MKIYAILAVAALLMSACGEKKEQASNLNSERDSLISVINQRDASINEFLAVNSEIEGNLDSIAVREGAITMSMLKETNLKPSQKDRINADITAINDLMKANRKKINDLNRKLKSTNAKVAEYDKMIEHLNVRVADKDKELTTLNDRLASLNAQVQRLETSVNILTTENAVQAQTIEQQASTMHTAYYVIGKSNELRDKKVINKTGGLLGIGKTSQLDPNVDNSNFTQIDYTKVNDISISSKDVKIITSHPAGSYTLDKDHEKITNLHITNPDKFWSASKYLVVVKD